jgi:hypothetical protein
MTHRPEQRSFRARHLAGPAARVGIHTAGPVVPLYLVATIVAFIAGGIAWWAAVGLALVPTLIVAAIAVLGFRQVASRCTRCGEWAELVDDGAGQALCARCWQVIAGQPRRKT